ncbi:MAG TPA: SPW repeat protein [Bradyrhizobium sp.]|nr:SPW repeat protein [Bradyrhizobium sp.]
MRKWQRESVLDLYNLLLAALLLVSPWLFRLTNSPGKLDLWATSAVIAVISLAAMVAYKNWEEWANLVLGLWLIVSPWLLGFAHTRAMHFGIGVGVVVAFLAALDLWLHYDTVHFRPSGQDQVNPSVASQQH